MMSSPSTLWAAAEAAAATGGEAWGDWAATGVSIDSRTIRPGDLFIALKGPHIDGHDYVAEALEKGAAAVVVSELPEGLGRDAPILLVADTTEALTGLARAARARVQAKVIAVTGSVGKTGTKDMLRLALECQGRTHATEGNLNNHWGLPLTLARMPRDVRFAVLEIGMNHAGELTPLSELARPHVAVITTIEAVHSAHFADVEAIADAKAEIFAGLVGGGVVVLNRDNSYFDRLAAAAGSATVIGFGETMEADVRLQAIQETAEGSTLSVDLRGDGFSYELGVSGRHWALNSLAVLAAVTAVGGDAMIAARALKDMHAPPGRGARHTVKIDDGTFDLIDESYNASPISMSAAFDVLAASGADRTVAVLGDMLELGDESEATHIALSVPLNTAGIDLVYTCGRYMQGLFNALPQQTRGGHAANSESLAPMVAGAVRSGDAVMVKGSAGSRMGVVVDVLLALGGSNGTGAAKHAANGR